MNESDAALETTKGRPDFVEKRFYWGLCYGLLNVKRMAAVIIEGGPDARLRAMELLADVKDECIYKDDYTSRIEILMRKWGTEG